MTPDAPYALSTPVRTARAHRPLPTCDAHQPTESLPEYASRVLRHLLATDTTATLTDEQLALADMAAQRAVSQLRGDDGRASRLDSAQLASLAALSAARRTIALVLEWRAQDDTRRASEALIPSSLPTGGSQGGRLAPLNPPPPSSPSHPTALPLPCTPQRRPTDAIRF